MPRSAELIITFATELIAEGAALQETKFVVRLSPTTFDSFVNIQDFQKWRTSCRLLLSQLGPLAEAWASVLGSDASQNYLPTVEGMIGALKSIRENATLGRLATFEDIVFAEAFVNLSDQATHLLSKGYAMAAAVIYRAVLEERLRRMCESRQCAPEKDRPTIADYNQALYKARVYDKILLKNVEMMAAVGNSATHASAELASSDVERLRDSLLGFLASFSPQ